MCVLFLFDFKKIVFLFFRNRVAIAIELIEEGSIACGQMLTTLFFPPLPFLFQVLTYVVVLFVVVVVFVLDAVDLLYHTQFLVVGSLANS